MFGLQLGSHIEYLQHSGINYPMARSNSSSLQLPCAVGQGCMTTVQKGRQRKVNDLSKARQHITGGAVYKSQVSWIADLDSNIRCDLFLPH